MELLDPWSVIYEAVSFIQEFKCSQLLCKTSVKEKALRWSPPPLGCSKEKCRWSYVWDDLHIGVSDIILESDSLCTVDALKKSSLVPSRQGPLVDEIKCLMASFKSMEVPHVGRNGNVVAHLLARHAQFVEEMSVWWFSFSDLIKQYVTTDSMLISYHYYQKVSL